MLIQQDLVPAKNPKILVEGRLSDLRIILLTARLPLPKKSDIYCSFRSRSRQRLACDGFSPSFLLSRDLNYDKSQKHLYTWKELIPFGALFCQLINN